MKKTIFILLLSLWMGGLSGQIMDEPDWHIFPSTKGQTEVHISINKRYPNIILVSANVDDNGTFDSQGYYYSQNGGMNWAGSNSIPNNIEVGGDPVTVFDADGNFYLVSMAKSGQNYNGYYVFSSTDQGANWNHIRGTGPSNLFDKPMATIFDDQQGLASTNYFYCAWTRFNSSNTGDAVMFNRSTDMVNSFDGAFSLTDHWGEGTNVQTGPNGEVYVCWADYTDGEYPADNLGFAYSNMAGEINSFTVSLPFSYDGIRPGDNFSTGNFGARTNDYPSMAVDRSCGPHHGRIYIAYPELDGQGNAIIDLRYSDNHGATFVNPPDPISTPDVEQAFFPSVACDPVTGIVVVAYHGLNSVAPFNETNTYVAYSNDGGVSFDNIKVSDVSHHRSEIPNTALPFYAGDYLGIDIYDGIAYAGWADPRGSTGVWQAYVSKLDLVSIAINRVMATSGDLFFHDHIFNDVNLTYKANNIWVSGNSSVSSSAILQLVGNNLIDLPKGFEVQMGADFQAFIDPFVCQTPGFVPTRQSNLGGGLLTELENKNDFILFPNPTSHKITLKTQHYDIALVTIFDLFGNDIYQKRVQEITKEIFFDLGEFSSGPYFVQVETSLGEVFIKKLLIEK